MSIIKIASLSCFLKSRKYWNNRIFECGTFQSVSNRKITPLPVNQTYQLELDKLRHQSNQRYVFSPRPKF